MLMMKEDDDDEEEEEEEDNKADDEQRITMRKNEHPRQYQVEIYQLALENNIIAYLDTGMDPFNTIGQLLRFDG